MGVPEDLKVGPSDHLHGRGDDEDEGQSNSHARQSSDGGEHGDGRVLQPEDQSLKAVTQTRLSTDTL